MRRRTRVTTARVTAVLATGLLTVGAVATAAPAGAASSSPVVGTTFRIVPTGCAAAPAAGHVACLSRLRLRELLHKDGSTTPAATTAPSGYGPSSLLSAYKLTGGGAGQTIALVDAYDDPTAEADLGVYRSQYGLGACTTANGCFTKVSQTGTTTYPSADGGWAQEESLDLDMASAIAPKAKIILVEASSATDSDLEAAENEAAKLGATEISNSYGGSEDSTETSGNAAYTHPGIAITASAGDSGYGVEFPAAAPSVTAVGGTSLKTASNSRGWTETVWGSGLLSYVNGGTGSGCSSYEAKPSWQKDTGCAKRTVADVSADADPNTGVAVYDSTAYEGDSGWLEFGGTSVASPIIAGVYADAGGVAKTVSGASLAYAHPTKLFDVTSGSNGFCSLSSAKRYLCTGTTGYDGPTGLGTPNGTGAF
jgi:subtilase family serine protease